MICPSNFLPHLKRRQFNRRIYVFCFGHCAFKYILVISLLEFSRDVAASRQKLSIILENKVLTFFDEFFLERFTIFLALKIDFESQVLALFDDSLLNQFTKYNSFLLDY